MSLREAIALLVVSPLLVAGLAYFAIVAGGGIHRGPSVARFRLHAGNGMVAVRAFGWQLDYRRDPWLPFSVREGKSDWRILRLGRFGNVTLGRLR